MSGDEPSTDELRALQEERAQAERDRARRAADTGEIPAVRAHDRRAERAEYLREKLDQRAESERDVAEAERAETDSARDEPETDRG